MDVEFTSINQTTVHDKEIDSSKLNALGDKNLNAAQLMELVYR